MNTIQAGIIFDCKFKYFYALSLSPYVSPCKKLAMWDISHIAVYTERMLPQCREGLKAYSPDLRSHELVFKDLQDPILIDVATNFSCEIYNWILNRSV